MMDDQKLSKGSRRSAACYILFILMSVFIILLKGQMHVDEIISYGSANHIGNMHIEIEDGKTYVPSAVPYLNYMTADKNNRFHYINVWQNQASDVHPPLYYAILHTICSIFPGTFSFWYAGGINILFGAMTLYMLRKLFRLLCGNSAPLNLLSVTYIVSAGIMTAVSFFRMYIMAMFFVTVIAYCFVASVGKALNARFYLAVIAASVLGALTHYYCIVYLVFTCLIFGIYLLFHRKYKEFGLFVCSMAGAGGLSVAIFPPMIKHIFTGYRGKESIDNLFMHSPENYIYRLREFWGYVNIELFGGCMAFILLTAVLFGVFGLLKKSDRNQGYDGGSFENNRERFFRWAILLIPVILYFLLVSKIAIYVTDRYLFPVYAVAVCIFTSMVFLALRKVWNDRKLVSDISVANLVMLMLSGIVIICSWGRTTWNYIYRNEAARLEAMEEYQGMDCIVVYDNRWKAEAAFLEVSIYNSVTFFPLANLELMDEFELSADNLIVLAIGDNDMILRQISDKFPGLNKYVEVGSYAYSTTYYFYHET